MTAKRKSILYMEDDEGLARLFQKRMAKNSYEVEITHDGKEGIKKFDTDKYHAIVVDYNMPVFNGMEVLQKLQEKKAEIPVIILTGQGDESLAVKALKLGAEDYIVKDTNQVYIDILPKVIESAISKKQLETENKRQKIELQHYVAELQEANEKLGEMAHYDNLTGLTNRLVFQDTLERSMSRAKRYGDYTALLFIDLDGFKIINDTYGHLAGDLLLKEISHRMKVVIRKSDHVSRLGGDEFAIVLEGLKDPKDATIVISKLFKQLSCPVLIEEEQLQITASIGIVVFPCNGDTIDELTRNADAAMYEAKEIKGNSYRFFTEDIHKKVIEEHAVQSDLQKGMRKGELSLYFQPKYCARTSKIIGAEALVRWMHPEKGFISPAEFIPIAEKSGLILELGEWVLKTSCDYSKEWINSGIMTIPISVNVSVQQFRQQDIVKKICNVLKKTGLNPNFLILELTETQLINNVVKFSDIMRKLREAGISISLDDFGTGFSSISHLRTLSVDEIKIDKSMIDNITTNKGDEVITKSIIDLAHGFNIKVTAEGVETQEQLEFLRSRNCDIVQGYLLAKPMPASEFMNLIKTSAVYKAG